MSSTDPEALPLPGPHRSEVHEAAEGMRRYMRQKKVWCLAGSCVFCVLAGKRPANAGVSIEAGSPSMIRISIPNPASPATRRHQVSLRPLHVPSYSGR